MTANAVVEAHRKLQRARDDLGGYITPCMKDERMWRDVSRNERGRLLYERVTYALDKCMDCAVFRACHAMSRIDTELMGVVAGEWRTENPESGLAALEQDLFEMSA